MGASEQQIYQILNSRDKTLEMLEQAIETLKTPDLKISSLEFKIVDGDNGLEKSLELIARNKYLNAIEAGLNMIKTVADMKQETLEELKKRLAKQSSK